MRQGGFITSAMASFVHCHSKKLAKKGTPEIPKAELITMKNPTDKNFTVGFAKCDVMPEDVTAKTYWMAGFKPNNKVTGVHDPMTANAMWIDCKDGGGIVLVSVDCIGITGHDINEIRASLSDFSKETGCKNISISCTHSHASIDTVGYWGKLLSTGKTKDYMDKLFASIKNVCIEAYKNRKEGKLFIGVKHVPEAIGTGRNDGPSNDRLTRLRFVPDDGSAETWLLNFGAHPNTLGGDNQDVSADYPYYLREKINETKETNVLFNVNAICGVNVNDKLSEDRLERAKLAGATLAKAAFSIENEEQLDPEIAVLRQQFYLPIDNETLAFLVCLGECTSDKFNYDKGTLELALRTELTYLRIGKQQILMIPGEAMPEFAYGGYWSAEESSTGKGPEINPKPLVEVAGDPDLLIFGVTNDMTGYMVPPNDFVLHETQPYLTKTYDRFDRGHYHETNSLGYLVTETISNTFADMMTRVK